MEVNHPKSWSPLLRRHRLISP